MFKKYEDNPTCDINKKKTIIQKTVNSIKELWNQIPFSIGKIENHKKRNAKINHLDSWKRIKGMASDGEFGTCFFAKCPDESILLVSSGHFFLDVIEEFPMAAFEEAFSDHVVNFGNLNGNSSVTGVSPLQKDKPMYFNDLLQEFDACGFIIANGKCVMLKNGQLQTLPQSFIQKQGFDLFHDDIFIVSLLKINIEEEFKSLGLKPLAMNNAEPVSKTKFTPSSDDTVTLFGHMDQQKLKNDDCIRDEDIESKQRNKTPLVFSIGKEFKEQQMSKCNEDGSSSSDNPSDKLFYTNYSSDGLSGSPVIYLTDGDSGSSYHLKGVHLGVAPSKLCSMAQKFPANILNDINALVSL